MRISLLLALLVLGGCAWKNPIDLITPHKIDVQQGNVITQEMVDQLKPGMTRSQVRFVLGTPLIVDPFRSDRWDYVYRFEKAGQLAEQRRLTVVFEDDRLKGIEGNVAPRAEAPQPAGEGK